MKKTDVFQGFGRRVQQLRKARGWSQDRLAEAIGKTVNTVSNIERGVNSTRLQTLVQLAEVFGVSVAELFDASSPKGKDQEHRRETAKMMKLLDAYDAQTVRHLVSLVSAALAVLRDKRKKPSR
ncbi:helix-turn-helix transcriptional regulator [bacterium]|nr:helix-turn-helix transcriptional regulator [bacterium]MBY0510193.1 helix-turn-helix transcriptional regulator [Rhodospirillaceae bacterium]